MNQTKRTKKKRMLTFLMAMLMFMSVLSGVFHVQTVKADSVIEHTAISNFDGEGYVNAARDYLGVPYLLGGRSRAGLTAEKRIKKNFQTTCMQ